MYCFPYNLSARGLKKALEKELVALSFPKNYLLLEAPRTDGFAYFLNEGFAMSYTFVDGKKRVESFWKAGQIMISSKSFFEQVPSTESIQLMENSELLCISYAGVMRLFERWPEANSLYRHIMIQCFEQIQDRVHDLQQLTAEQRHQKLLETFPDIEQIISQDYIASYLGITPQSLSRIKRLRRRA
ncbi:MAG: Crp/Fnr family transcriptional regulator [Bacteroidota bacterium]